MRKIGFIRQEGRIKEVLPHSYHIHSLSDRRKMFLSMLNTILPSEVQFSFSRCEKLKDDIYTLLHNKVVSYLPLYRLRPERGTSVRRILVHESGVINRYLNLSKTPKGLYLARNGYQFMGGSCEGYVHPAASVASLMVQENDLTMMLNLDELFTQTVFSRIKTQDGSTLSREDAFIHITENGRVTRLHPRWKRVQPQMLTDRRNHIERAFLEMERDSIDAYYLVYPKMDDFTRHIVVQNRNESALKIIPYSFTFCTKEKHATK